MLSKDSEVSIHPSHTPYRDPGLHCTQLAPSQDSPPCSPCAVLAPPRLHPAVPNLQRGRSSGAGQAPGGPHSFVIGEPHVGPRLLPALQVRPNGSWILEFVFMKQGCLGKWEWFMRVVGIHGTLINGTKQWQKT